VKITEQSPDNQVNLTTCTCSKDGTNLEFNLNRISDFKYESNIQWLQIWLEYWIVSRCFARMWHHLVAMSSSPCQRCQHHRHRHQSFYLLADLIMKTTSYSHQSYHRISYVLTRNHNPILLSANKRPLDTILILW